MIETLVCLYSSKVGANESHKSNGGIGQKKFKGTLIQWTPITTVQGIGKKTGHMIELSPYSIRDSYLILECWGKGF